MKTNSEEHSASDLAARFSRGVAAGLNPENATVGAAITVARSPWLHQHCPRSHHTFRRGDSVWIEANGIVRHSDEMLARFESIEADPAGSDREIAEFFRGLDRAWPPPPDLVIVRLKPGDKLLAPPQGRLLRRSCAICGHTFRLHDHVVICPCSHSLDQAPCEIAIHRDPIHGLHCYDAWNPSSGSGGSRLAYCPVSSRKLHE